MGNEGGDSSGFNLNDFAGIALPILGTAAGIMRPQAAPAFASLSQSLALLQYRTEQQKREDRAQKSLAEQLATMGVTSDPTQSTETQISFANLQGKQAENKRQEIERQQEQEFTRRAGALPSDELPETNIAAIQQFPTVPKFYERQEKLLTREQEKARRIAEARRTTEGFERQRTMNLQTPAPPPDLLGLEGAVQREAEGPPPSLGVEPLSAPPMTYTQLPPGAQDLQYEITQGLPMGKPLDVARAKGLDPSKLPGGPEALMAQQTAAAGLRATSAQTRKSEAEASALEIDAPFSREMKILQLQKLRQEVEQGKMPALPGEVVAELRGTAGVNAVTPTPDQVRAAIVAVDQRLTARAVETSREQGVNAANVPARTPPDQLKGAQNITLARSQMDELSRLAPAVNLPNLVGGIRPWVNQILQTGKIGPVPVPSSGSFTPEQNRFMALIQDYADSVLRLRSGAQINEQEYARMLGFLAQQGITADVFVARMQLQSDLLAVRQQIDSQVLTQGGYRAPSVEPPSLNRSGPRPKSTGGAEIIE